GLGGRAASAHSGVLAGVGVLVLRRLGALLRRALLRGLGVVSSCRPDEYERQRRRESDDEPLHGFLLGASVGQGGHGSPGGKADVHSMSIPGRPRTTPPMIAESIRARASARSALRAAARGTAARSPPLV